MIRKIQAILRNVSTVPRRKSYVWRDGHISILSLLLLWSIYFCRLFSVLQWVKLLYRKTAHRRTIDKGSKRVNVPTAVVELYFCTWLAFLTLTYLKLIRGNWTVLFSYYFIFESTVWVLYYFIFRRFFEENYKINHVLEYFVTLIVLIPAQALAFSNCYGTAFHETMNAVLGIQTIEACYFINIVGVVYQVIVIAMIISTFPAEASFVKAQNAFDNTIIGAGDVVCERLLPELQYRQEMVSNIFSVNDKDSRAKNCKCLESTDEIVQKVNSTSAFNTIIWIETPTPSHVEYLKKLKDTDCKLIVLEKPVAVTIDDLDWVSEHILKSNFGNKVFFLSYYMLEKALPIVYWMNRTPAYTKYLKAKKQYRFISGLPKNEITKIEVVIIEGNDTRDWVSMNGGHLLETFVHNILIATLFAGLPDKWTDIKWEKKDVNEVKLSATAASDQREIVLWMKKNAGEKERKRYIQIEFGESRYLFEDLDTEELFYCEKTGGEIKKYSCMSVKRNYRRKYAIQTDLVYRVANGELECKDVDGREKQIECLRWLIDSK